MLEVIDEDSYCLLTLFHPMARHPLASGRTVLVWWPSLALGGIEAKREALSPRSAREACFGIRGRGLVSSRLEEDVVYFCIVSIGWFQVFFFISGNGGFDFMYLSEYQSIVAVHPN